MKGMIKTERNEEDSNYLNSISRDELLTVEEEVELIRQIQHGDGDISAAKEKLLRANQRFVHTVAKQYVTKKHPLDRLIG